MVERDRCEERETAALVQERRGVRWMNERDETQNVGTRMEEGWKILKGREVESYITSGSRWKVKGKDGKCKGRNKGISKLKKDVQKTDKDEE